MNHEAEQVLLLEDKHPESEDDSDDEEYEDALEEVEHVNLVVDEAEEEINNLQEEDEGLKPTDEDTSTYENMTFQPIHWWKGDPGAASKGTTGGYRVSTD